jgi:hypothetical protein
MPNDLKEFIEYLKNKLVEVTGIEKEELFSPTPISEYIKIQKEIEALVIGEYQEFYSKIIKEKLEEMFNAQLNRISE